MMELIENAWAGWMEFTSDGKLPALFLASLIYLWLAGSWKAQKVLFSYAAGMAVCCVVPVTAAILMAYQTRFYDYVWLWSLVPVTAVTAWAAAELTDKLQKELQPTDWKKSFPVTALLLAVLMLSGGLGKAIFNPVKEREERRLAQEIITEAKERKEGELCLWAPQEIMAYVREFDGSVRLIYGRDMWDTSLGAYTYDTYSREISDLYVWMENMNEAGVFEWKTGDRGKIILQGNDCVAKALGAGANCILLPEHLEEQTVRKLAEAADAEVFRLEEYYLLIK